METSSVQDPSLAPPCNLRCHLRTAGIGSGVVRQVLQPVQSSQRLDRPGGNGTYNRSIADRIEYDYYWQIRPAPVRPIHLGVPQDGDWDCKHSASVRYCQCRYVRVTFIKVVNVLCHGVHAVTIGAGATSGSNAQYSATYPQCWRTSQQPSTFAQMSQRISQLGTAGKVYNTVYARANGNNLSR